MNALIRQYANAYASLSGFTTDFTPKRITLFNSVSNQSCMVVVSALEPTTEVMPLNVIWLVQDKQSKYYQQFLIRTSKTNSAEFVFTWTVLTEIAQLYVPQYYDATDNSIYSGKLADATTTVAGIAKISTVSSTPTTPVFVSTSDPRLTDTRNPKTHTHAERAMRLVKTLTGSVDIQTSTSTSDSVAIVADNATTATQRKLKKVEVL